jgi:protein-S-isoprenylcysteine O-methyltransferase Ste14
MKPIMWFGTLLVLLGILGLAIPMITTSHTKDVIKLGNFRIQSTERYTHVVPPALCAGVLVLGVIFLGAGLYRNR